MAKKDKAEKNNRTFPNQDVSTNVTKDDTSLETTSNKHAKKSK